MTFDKFKVNGSSIFVFLGYAVSIGAIFQCAYWSVFKINLFDFISSFQALEICLLSTTPYFIIFLFATLHGVMSRMSGRTNKNDANPNTFKQFLKLYLVDIIFFLISTAFVILATTGILSSGMLWIGVAGMAAVTLSNFLQENLPAYFPQISPENQLLLFYFLFIPVWAFCCGKYSAHLIYDGSQFLYAETAQLDLANKATIEGQLKYIGKLGEYVIFSDAQNKGVLIVPAKTTFPLQLMQSKPPANRE